MVGGLVSLIVGVLVTGAGLLYTDGLLRIIILVPGVIWIVCGIIMIRNHIVEKNTPLLTAQAKVFAKTTNTSGGGTSYIGDGQFSSDTVTTKHFISFEFNNRRENVEVLVALFNTLKENDTGVLEYKDINGSFRFISFQRQT